MWWNVMAPRLNSFDMLYNLAVATRNGMARLGPAPSSRRFALAVARTFTAAIAGCLYKSMPGAGGFKHFC